MRPARLLTLSLLLLWACGGVTRAQDAAEEASPDGEEEKEEVEEEEEKPKKEKTAEIEEEKDVMELHLKNFDRALSEKKYLLVEFYAPWCGHCKNLAPVYEEAASRLKSEDKDMGLAKVDAIEEKELAEEFDIRGYPDVKLFLDGDRKKPKDYSGERSADGIVLWMKRQASPGAPTLDSPASAADFIHAHNISVVGFFKDLESDAAKVVDELYFETTVQFAKTSSAEVFSKYKVETDSVVLFKKFDEGRVDLPLTEHFKLDRQNLTSFIQDNSMELITKFSPEKAQAIFSASIKTHALMFINSSIDAQSALIEEARSVAKEFKGKILFITIDVTDTADKILEFFGVSADEVPTASLYEMVTRRKFKLAPGPFAAALRQLCQAVMDGTAEAFFLSQDVPEDWDKGPVKVLVGKNFESVALDPTKNVFVEFYAPWCDLCKQLAPIWEALGEKYADHENIVIAKMDSTTNEVEDVKISGFPTITYFRAGDNEAITYYGDKTVEKMSEFLDNGGVLPEEPEEEEDEDEEVEENETDKEEVGSTESTNNTNKDEL